MASPKPVACIEMGGTTAAVAIADKLGSFLWKKKGIPTAPPVEPATAVKEVAEALKSSGYEFDVIGIASFGPLDILDGCIGNTPKPLWRRFPLVAELRKYFPEQKIFLETDVNAPAYSEYLALQEKEPGTRHSVVYITVGTGVGGGVFSDGKPYHGMMHPEFGHLQVERYPGDDFAGTCPFHKSCLEGMVASGALGARLGIDPSKLPEVSNDDPVWDKFCYYIGQMGAACAYVYSADRVFVGGGIMTGEGREFLYVKANEWCRRILNGYVEAPLISPPNYQKDAGLVGAAAVAFHPEVFGELAK